MNPSVISLFIFCGHLLFLSSTFGYEVDHFSGRDVKPVIQDSADIINAELNRLVDLAVNDANKKNTSMIPAFNYTCDSTDKNKWNNARKNLFENLRDLLTTAPNPIGVLERFTEKNDKIDKRKIPLDRSIYKSADKTILQIFGLHSVIKVGDIEIGTDKLGHFLNEGYTSYLEYKYEDNYDKRTAGARKYTREDEKGKHGLFATGILSYADYSANNAGFKFWHKLCGLTSTNKSDAEKEHFKKHRCYPDSIIKCENGNWIRNPNNKLDIRDFVTDAWDESINCSSFLPEISDSVFKEMTMRVHQWKGNPKQPCPRDQSKCLNLVVQGSKTLNPICENVGYKLKKGLAIDPKVKFDYTYSETRRDTLAERAKAKLEKDRKFIDAVKANQKDRR